MESNPVKGVEQTNIIMAKEIKASSYIVKQVVSQKKSINVIVAT